MEQGPASTTNPPSPIAMGPTGTALVLITAAGLDGNGSI